jgi:nucleoside-diphosphate-sugar epimerase
MKSKQIVLEVFVQKKRGDQGMVQNKFSIIGCGWLGLPLAQKLIEAGQTVSGSTTRVEKMAMLRDSGIEATLLRLDLPQDARLAPPSTLAPPARLEKLLACSTLVVTIPPSGFVRESQTGGDRGTADGTESASARHLVFAEVIEELITSAVHFGALERVLFVSSTSVYGDVNGSVTELSPLSGQTDNAKSLIHTEEMLARRCKLDRFGLTIVRPAGLMGFGRHPGRFLAGKTGLKDPDQGVNLIHQTDLNNCLRALLMRPRAKAPLEGAVEIFNAAAASHPTRREYYQSCARNLGLPLPQFDDQDPARLPGKIILSRPLKEVTGVRFEFDDLVTYVSEKKN